MATDVTKIKLPDNSTVNIKDYRIPGVDSTPTSGSGNVVTSGGIYSSLGGKQNTLVSGTNIKTVNNTSLLGSGNINTPDTKNTAGSTDTSDKIYLIGATSQATNPQTYSDNEVYTTSGVLTTKSVQVGGTAATMQYNSTDQSIEFIFA